MQTKITAQEIIKLIPNELLKNFEEETKANYQVKKLTGKTMFKLLLLSTLDNERVSLRTIENIYNSEKFKLFTGENINNKKKTKHTSLSDRLKTINSDFFKKIFEFLVEKFSKILNLKNIQKQNKVGGINIQRFDSTLVGLSAKLLKEGFIHGGSNKRPSNTSYIKFTIGTNNFGPNSVILQDNISEETSLKKAILKSSYSKDGIVTFDRGLQSRLTFKEFDEKGIQFVTRLNNAKKRKLKFETVKIFKEIQGRKTNTGLELQDDLIVYLKTDNIKLKHEFRLIKAKIIDETKDQYGEEIYFLTNNLDLNAREITDIYKRRWDIEVFFKFIKQELNFKHFLSRSLNGIKVMAYMTLISSILLLVYKYKNKINGFKIAKYSFILDLEVSLMKDFAKSLLIACNGDISKMNEFLKPLPD